MVSLREKIKQDVRIKEGLHACMNCGICTAVCPAAEYFEYDPRSIVVAVQSGNEEQLKELLESDTIWMCGQCMSCKVRCPRNNCPGLIISVLRKFSQETGAFTKSRLGRQQYLVLKNLGTNIFKFGYCTHPSTVIPTTHPEQGPVWEWIYNNQQAVFDRVGANLDKTGPGAMRKIAHEDLKELEQIFNTSGGTLLNDAIEKYSKEKAIELGFVDDKGGALMDKYLEFLLNDEQK
jgi:heterodisulfide reductase subunit C